MIELGAAHGCPVIALLTAMDRPLGHACGNALEVIEAIEMLKGGGPPDFVEVTFALGAEMLLLGGVSASVDAARADMKRAISTGLAAEKFEEIIAAQGGDSRVVNEPSLLPAAACKAEFEAPASGFVTRIEPRTIGYGVIALGGGRRNMEETVDPSVGFVITAKPGDRVEKGQPIATIHTRRKSALEIGRRTLQDAITIGESPIAALPLVSHRISSAGVEELG
jgi:pyrimidine-nucleoside phosphorylase